MILYKNTFWIIIVFFIKMSTSYCEIDSKPFYIFKNNIVKYDPKIIPFFVGSQKRLATTSGIAFTHNQKFLASVNLAAHAIDVFEFDSLNTKINFLYSLSSIDGLEVKNPEDLTFSKNNRYLFINSSCNGKIFAYQVNPENCSIDPCPIQIISLNKDSILHQLNILMINDQEYLAVAKAKYQSIEFFKIDDPNNLFKYDHSLQLQLNPSFAVKGFDVSPNSKYLATCSTQFVTLSPCPRKKIKSEIQIFKINSNHPKSYSLIYSSKSFGSLEMLKFVNDSEFAVTDQLNHQIRIYNFDNQSNTVNLVKIIEKEPGALSFPHGIDLSPDKKILVVTNYGFNTLNFFHINLPRPLFSPFEIR